MRRATYKVDLRVRFFSLVAAKKQVVWPRESTYKVGYTDATDV